MFIVCRQNYCHSLDIPGRLLNNTLESGENTVWLNQEECSESTQKQVQKHRPNCGKPVYLVSGTVGDSIKS